MAGTVTVACKMPHGLTLRLFQMVDVEEAQPGGFTKTVKQSRVLPGRVTLKGYAEKYNPALPPAAVDSSYALTHGVDKDFWEAWLAQNKDLDAVTNGLVFAADKADSVNGMMKDHAKTKSGLEPIDPNNLPRGVQDGRKAA